VGRVVFRGRESFETGPEYVLLPFRFLRVDGRRLLVNEVGEHHFLDAAVFDRFVGHALSRSDPEYLDLRGKHFLSDAAGLDTAVSLLAAKYRTKRSFLAGFTGLHIFVVTLRCDHSCHYCQVSRVSANRQKYDMSAATAERALDLAFRSPANPIKIEFQGGEPLLNFDLVRDVVLAAKAHPARRSRALEFVIATNLAFLSDSILEFCKEHGILLSTSLDGPSVVHNANRPRPENNSYELTIEGLRRAREVLGFDRVSAIMTTSRSSLDYPEAIVDEYVSQGFDHIFLRPISPYGFAIRTQRRTGYELDRWLDFYKTAFARIIEVNRSGTFLVEDYAAILLTKMLTPFGTGYVDLQSPAGLGIRVAVYNYDGDVYASDEARMLAEMGDRTFRIGNVHSDTYEAIFGQQRLRDWAAASVIESLPGCADCAFQTYCGVDPLENYTKQGDVVGHRPTSEFHHRNFTIIGHLMNLYHGGDQFVRELFWSWVQNRPVRSLVPILPA